MRRFLILSLLGYITITDQSMCNVKITEREKQYICNPDRCGRHWVGPFNNATCKNLDQMHATPQICDSECTIVFTDKIDVIRTNSFSLLNNLDQVFLNNTGIETVQSRPFSGLHRVQLIHLGYNFIKIIHKDTFSELSNIKYLDVNSNRIELIENESFNGCKTLEYLDLSNNLLQNFSTSTIDTLFQLKTLNLSRNNIKVMDQNLCFHLHSLESLILENNQISSLVNCTSNYNIKIFSLAYNNLMNLNGSFFPTNLLKLNLSGNRISKIENQPLENLDELRILDLSKNHLNSLPFGLFDNLVNLLHLDLSSNNITTLNEGVFHGLRNLKFLNLSKINSPGLEVSVFYSTKHVVKLDLSENNMISLDVESLLQYCPELNYLRIDRNSFMCKELAQILIYADKKKISILPGQSFKQKNLKGILCVDEQEKSTNPKSTNYIIDYFETGFKRSSFFKFFSTFHQPNEENIHEFMDSQKLLIKTISDEIRNTGDKISQNLARGQENLRRIDGTNELLRKLVEIVKSSDGSGKSTNLTSELFTMLDKQNQAAFTSENTDMKNIIVSLDYLKVIFMIFLILMISFGVVVLFRHFKNLPFVNNFSLDSQELPIIERHNSQII